MRPSKTALLFSLSLLLISSLYLTNASAENHKCKTADGKIEYSDRPCVIDKQTAPASATNADKPTSPSLERLNQLFAEYEERLCQRERLSNETDRAARNATLHLPVWAAKEAKLRDLNEDLVQFQTKASKFTSGKASDSEETMAVRQFQIKVRKCGKLPS
jgi:membrane-bound lytic murein transglycosylase